jgi:hypothetical protein
MPKFVPDHPMRTGEYYSVTPSTKIHIEDRPLERKHENKADISGCCRQLSLLPELISPGIRQSLRPSLEGRMLSCTTSTFAHWTRCRSDIDPPIDTSDLGNAQTWAAEAGPHRSLPCYVRRTGACTPRRRSAANSESA